MFTKHKRVFDVRHGWGTVTSVGHFDGFPVKVEFENGRKERYSHEGFMSIDSRYPSLFPADSPLVGMMESAEQAAHVAKLHRENQ